MTACAIASTLVNEMTRARKLNKNLQNPLRMLNDRGDVQVRQLQWTLEEDMTLLEGVDEYTTDANATNWERVKFLVQSRNRTAEECRERVQ